MQTYIKSIIPLIAALFVTTSCGSDPQGSETNWWMGGNSQDILGQIPFVPNFTLPRGHEELTFQAIRRANELIESDNTDADPTKRWPRFEPLPGDAQGATTTHALMLGNFATDVPAAVMGRVGGDAQRDLVAAYKKILEIPVSADLDWHHEPRLQMLHFLRNPHGQTAAQACQAGQDHIDFITRRTTLLWAMATNPQVRQELNITDEPALLMERSLFWAGVGTHVIQDSFSPGHVRRMGNARRNVSDVCTFGEEVDGVCFHDKVAWEDNIWSHGIADFITGQSSPANDPDERFDALRPEAKDAVLATSNYLRRLAFLYHEAAQPSGLLGIWTDNQLFDFFHIWHGLDREKALSEGSGWFRCQDQNVLVPSTTPGNPVIQLNGTSFKGGDLVVAGFGGLENLGPKAYFGMLPHNAGHDAKPLDAAGEPPTEVVAWLAKENFAAAATSVKFEVVGAGQWDVRLFADDGTEVTLQTFDARPSVRLSADSVAPGAAMVLAVDGDSAWDEKAFIAVTSASIALDPQTTNGAAVAKLELQKRHHLNVNYTAPQTPGAYQVRLYDGASDALGTRLQSIAAFIVKGPNS